MDEKEITSTVDDSSLTTPQSSNIVDRILQETTQPDFAIPKTKTIGDITKEYQMYITPTVAQGIVDRAGLHTSVGEQTAAAIKNVLVDLSATGDKARIAVGNIANLVSGGNIGEEWQNIAFENLGKLYEDMAHREGSVGGITSNLAQLAAGATSFIELALVGLATAGYGSLAQIAVQTLGEGAYNDMQAYIDEHGSTEGYRPEGSDVALNIANTLFQVGSEAILGVGSPRFFTGWSRGLWKEGVGGFVQEFSQGLVNDLFEAYKGNKTMAEMLDNADQYLRDGIIGAVLQGGLGAATYGTKRARADRILAHSIAQVRGHQTPTKEDNQDAKAMNDAKERAYMTGFTEEFKKRFDATSPVGQLQQKIATAINDAYKAGKIDFGGASETQIAQKIEAFAAQETLNAMEDSAERKQSIGEHELNGIVFKGAEGAKEGELWLAGLEPEVGERSVDLAKVLEYRQSGLAEINAELEVLDGEIKQLRKQLAETTVDVKEAQKELLKEQIKKKEGQAESKRLKKTQLEASNARLYASIEKMSAPKAEKASEQKSLKAEREQGKAVKEQRKQAREKKPETAKDMIARSKKKEDEPLEQGLLFQSRPDQSRLDKGDTYRGAYDEKLKRIILNEKSDLTTIQHEFAHYWIQNNFRWYRSGLASDDWKRNWERVEQALGIEPTDKYLSKVASEKFARAYERYIMEGKVAPEYQWAFAEFQEFYNEVYEDLKAEYFDLNEELSPELIDWFNRQRPVAPEQVAEMTKKQVYQGVADFATKLDEQPAEEISDGVYTASAPNNEGGVEEEVFVEIDKARKSKLAVYRETTSESNIAKRLREKNPNLTADKYANLNRAETVEQAIDWVTRDFDSAWQAFIDPKTNVKDRAALFIALERESANNPQLAIDLLEYRNEATELGQAVSILAERPQISTVEILALEQEALGAATDEQVAKEISDSDVNGAVSEDRIKQLKELTECVL